VAHLRADGKDFLNSTFGNEQMMLIVFGYHHRHAAAIEIERYFIYLAVVLGWLQLAMHFGVL
jgi:hypothetical protein